MNPQYPGGQYPGGGFVPGGINNSTNGPLQGTAPHGMSQPHYGQMPPNNMTNNTGVNGPSYGPPRPPVSGGMPPSSGFPSKMGPGPSQAPQNFGPPVGPYPPSQTNPGQAGPPPSMGRPPTQQGQPVHPLGAPPNSASAPNLGRPPSQQGTNIPPAASQNVPRPPMGFQGVNQGQAGPPAGRPPSQQGLAGPRMGVRPPTLNGVHSGAGRGAVPVGYQGGPVSSGPAGVGVRPPPMPSMAGPPPPNATGPPPMNAGGPPPPLTNNISTAPPPVVSGVFNPSGPPRPSFPPLTSTQGPPPLSGGLNSQPVPPAGIRPPGINFPPSVAQPNAGGVGGMGPPLASRPGELPMPYHGAGQFSNQHQELVPTPSGSEPPGSQRSSRAHTPQQHNYDNLEGQFTPSGGPPPIPGQPQIYQNMPQGAPPSVYGQMPPNSSFGGPLPPPSTNQQIMPPQGVYNPSMGYPQPGMPQPPVPATNQPPAGLGALPPNQSQQKYPTPASGHHHPPQKGYRSAAGGVPPYAGGSMVPGFGQMSLQDDNRPVNLLQERQILPPVPVDSVVPNLPTEYKKSNCSADVMSCTLNAIPSTQSLLSKTRLPLGVLIHPFKDLAQLPVIQSSVIVRCRSCRTYINPFVSFVDARRWKCNLCYRVNDLPDEFNYDPVSKTYGEPQRRPEIKSGTIEFIAPTEYMLRPPQPAVYLFLLDVSFNAVDTGYLSLFCQTLLEELDKLPGDSRTMIGFIAYDSSLYYFGLDEEASQPQVYVISDLEEVFLPTPDSLLVNLNQTKSKVIELLERLPALFEKNLDTGNALGPALLTSYKLMQATGGRVTVMQTMLPSVGEGALKCREDPNERAGSKVHNLSPVTDFYKKLALDCSGQQIAVDVFMLSSQYADIATIACVSKYSGGSLHYFPGFHSATNPSETDRYENTLRRYLTRKIGFEAVMRIRCTKGLSIHTFHGNFFVRSTDLLSLPNINPEAGYGMQLSIDDTLESNYVCFQAALLYTSSKAERRIRVHTLCIPVTSQLSDVQASADQKSIAALLAKMAVDKAVGSSLGDAREAMINSVVDMIGAYGATLNSGQRVGQVPCPYQLRLMPLYVLAMLKSIAFRVGTSTKLDERVYAHEQCKNLPVQYLLTMLHPNLYPVHSLDDRVLQKACISLTENIAVKPATFPCGNIQIKNAISKEGRTIPQPPRLPLSAAHVDRHGAYLLDTGDRMLLWVGAAVSDLYCQEVLDVQSFHGIVDGVTELPELNNPTSERLRSFIQYLNEQRPIAASLTVIREDSRSRLLFIEHLIEDRTESSLSYVEFLQHIQKELKS